MATNYIMKKVNVVIGTAGGVVTELEVFSGNPHGEELAGRCFRQLCKAHRVTTAQPSDDRGDVRWVVAKLRT